MESYGINDLQVTSDVTYILMTSESLFITTTSNYLKVFFLNLDISTNSICADNTFDEKIRNVEQGSQILFFIPSTNGIVLQIPRGNLETIYPRTIILSGLRELIKKKNYKEAFDICKIHYIDMNILCDLDMSTFIQNISLFIDQLESSENLRLFNF